MKHHPQIVYRDAEHVTNLFAGQTVDLTERKRARGPRRQGCEAVAENAPEITVLNEICGTSVPLSRSIIVTPMILPLVWALEEFIVLRTFIRSFAEWRFATMPPKLIGNLVLQ